MAQTPVRYRSGDEDSARWEGFAFRDGDIVISTRSKSGTTWMQVICALLVFQRPDPPAPLAELSPWLDFLGEPYREVHARLAAQTNRRFVKTHTPLDGVPADPRADYIVVARHPLDMAVSLYHQGENIDRERLHRLTGRGPAPRTSRPALREWLLAWVDSTADPREQMDSLPGVMHHLCDAWARREEPNVHLVHYDDLSADLSGEMHRLAAALHITVPEAQWPRLVAAATFERMRDNATAFVPDFRGVLKDRAAFFRRGRSGAAREVLGTADLAHYRQRVHELAPASMLEWLHRDAP